MNVAFNDQPRPVIGPAARSTIRIVIVGHVDHGKSTLIGRLLHETGSLPADKLKTLKQIAARRGMEFEWSFLLDALQTERDQGITIDTSQIRFRTTTRDVILIDAPGHAEFLRNMITGAAQADAAILIVDAVEGIRDQTRRHAYLLHLLGIRQVAVVVNKMDCLDFDASRFAAIRDNIVAYLRELGLVPAAVIPISARHGDGVARRSSAMVWHDGPTVLGALDGFAVTRTATELPFRLPVQAVYKFDDRRILAGRIETGAIKVGDDIVVAPGGKFARVKSIETWPVPELHHPSRTARAGQSIGITLDREIFVQRGDLVGPATAPAPSGRHLRARIFWLGREPLVHGTDLIVRIGTGQSVGIVTAIVTAVDPGVLTDVDGDVIGPNQVGEIDVLLSQPLASDPHNVNPGIGRVALERDGRILGGGLVLALNDDEKYPEHRISPQANQSDLQAKAARLAPLFLGLSAAERIRRLRREITGRIVFTTSFGLEDQVITHMICASDLDIDLVTLDTGRLFPETYDLWAETERRLGRHVRAIYPQQAELGALIDRQGINGFYDSRQARLACCQVRKVEPLSRALAAAGGWITGLRAEQSAGRRDMALLTAERGYRLIKLNPLFDWLRDSALEFAKVNNIPLNPLHGRGFASIGCAPCTRAISPSEPERAGRWWWEDESKKECGLHLHQTT